MKKVLLAVDSISPDRKAFHYAVQFCRRIKAELNVLQIIRPRNYGEVMKRVRSGTRLARNYMEGSMLAATFAEAGEHETAREVMAEVLRSMKELLPESKKAGVKCHLTARTGNPEKEIPKYVHENRDVILTIYDAGPEGAVQTAMEQETRGVARHLTGRLPVPLVVMHSGQR